MLYMFQAASPPIIRSSKLYTQHLVHVIGRMIDITLSRNPLGKTPLYQ